MLLGQHVGEAKRLWPSPQFVATRIVVTLGVIASAHVFSVAVALLPTAVATVMQGVGKGDAQKNEVSHSGSVGPES